jgi:site-specific DNA-methyltransferase (adenine-specific)
MNEKPKFLIKNIEELIPYENNPRNNDAAVPMVAESIKEFGFKVPIIIDKDNVIIAGHTRLKAAKMLGLKEVPCIMADDLTDEQAKAFRLADNKVAELSEWNFEKLEIELEGLDEIYIDTFDLDFGSFAFDDEQDFNDDEEIDLNAQPRREEIECPNCSFRFEI